VIGRTLANGKKIQGPTAPGTRRAVSGQVRRDASAAWDCPLDNLTSLSMTEITS